MKSGKTTGIGKKAACHFASLAEPRIHVSGRFPMRMEFGNRVYEHGTIALHQHDYPCTIFIGKRRFAVKPGDVTVAPPGVVSRYELGSEGFHWCVHFEARSGKGKYSIPFHIRPGAAAPYVAERMERITHLQRLADMNRNQRELFATAASAALSDLLCWLMVFAREGKTRRKGRMENAVMRLQKVIEHRLRERITVAELAREIGLSQDYLAQQFRRHFGMTLQRHLLSRRIEMARNLLLSTDLPVKAVGWECGIADQQYFNKQFRRICGMSPSQFREAGFAREA